MKRIVCLRLPSWPMQRLIVAQPELKGRVVILHERDPRRGLCVVAYSQAAYQRGIRRGMPLAEATSLAPDAYLVPHAPQADVEALEVLAQWCERFSPIVGIGPCTARGEGPFQVGSVPDHLYLDATDLASHFGGEQALAQQMAQAFEQRGYCVRVALASTLGAAWALAYYATHMAQPLMTASAGGKSSSGSTFLVVPAAASWAVLQPLPVRALRLPPHIVALLEQLGVRQIGQLAQLPRKSLAVRFGDLLLQRWDQLLGQASEPLLAHHAPPRFHAHMPLEHPTDHLPRIASLLKQLIEQLTRALQARNEGVLELVCRFRCTPSILSLDDSQRTSRSLPAESLPAESLSLRVGLFQPTAVCEHLMQLVQMQLEHLVLPGGVEQVMVEASLTAPLVRRQRELFPDGSRCAPLQLAQLVDRLSSRLGAAAVLGPRLAADVQPEQAYRYIPLTGQRRMDRHTPSSIRPSRSPQRQVRPLHLRSPPLPLAVVAIVPDGPPIRFHLPPRLYRVVRYWGPERIETGWWRGRSVRRDYYRVETDGGHWFWIFRRVDDGQWFLHGMFG
ncbi:MAG: Y-family DNA polymerase [Pirellulaceae bacterium]